MRLGTRLVAVTAALAPLACADTATHAPTPAAVADAAPEPARPPARPTPTVDAAPEPAPPPSPADARADVAAAPPPDTRDTAGPDAVVARTDTAPAVAGPETALPKTTANLLPVPAGFPSDAISDLPAHAELGGTIHRDVAGNFWIWIPPNVREVRGILWHTELFRRRNMKPILAHHGFALMKVHGPIKSRINAVTATADAYKAALLGALRELGKASNHPELENAPIFASCFAQDAPWCRSLALYMPERVLGHMQTSFNVPYQLAKYPPHLGQTPGLFAGNSEEFQRQATVDALQGPFNAGLAISWGAGHFSHPVLDILFAYVDQTIKLRLPAGASAKAGPVTLTPLARNEGWLLDHRASLAGEQGIYAPAATYPKDKEQASWVPSAFLAATMQGFNNETPNVRMTAPTTAVTGASYKATAAGEGLGPLKAGQSVVLRATADAAVTDVVFFDGDRMLGKGERQGTGFSLGPVRFDEPGVHALMAEGAGGGKKRMSRPALLFVVAP